MPQVYELTGELTDDRHVVLDTPVPLAPGKVKVKVIVEEVATPPKRDLRGFLERIWEEQRQRGHVPPTKEEVDAYINAERDSWDF